MSTVALAIAIPCVLTGLSAASAQASARPSHAVVSQVRPDLMTCSPVSGTIMSGTATSNTSAWSPSNLTSALLAGPGTITWSENANSSVSRTISANFTIEEGFIFASAKEQYGLALADSHGQSQTWSYSKTVPAGKTERLQQYHQSWEIGIRQTYMGYTTGGICHVYTETSLTGNFFPDAAGGGATWCYALTPNKKGTIEVGYACKDQ